MFKQYQILTSLSCNLRCTYCYESFNDRVNTLEDCKLFLKAMFARDSNYHKLQSNRTVIIDYIGGEPFLHPDLLEGIMDYCETIKKDYYIDFVYHSISTNGTLLKNPKCKRLLNKYKNQIGLGISIDGTKEKHNLHRLTINGLGSYDNAVLGLKVAKEIGVSYTHLKATFTRKTIPLYFDSFKNLVTLKPDSLHMNFAFEEIITEQDGIHIALEMMNSMEWLLSLPKKDRVNIYMYLENGEVLSMYNPIVEERIKPLDRNRCGTANEMSCLGFDRKLYGCNRFVSMSRPGMELGILKDDGTIENINQQLSSEIKSAYKSLPSWCNSCRHNTSCSDCVAISYDEGLPPSEMYKQSRQCGFTKAKELVKIWVKRVQQSGKVT